jgi:alpha-1,2-mannosyltransferase
VAADKPDALTLVRDAAWMDADRAGAYRNILLLVPIVTVVLTILLSHDGLDLLGKPIGTDFLSFWTAARLALNGPFAAAYDTARHWAAQKLLFPGTDFGYEAFFYPPVFLLICLPLGLAGYFPALVGWLLATGVACWAALRRLAGGSLPPLTFLAFPGVYINGMHGQNGYLTTALLAAGVAAMPARPWLAGICFGGLVFKPHLLAMVPVALIASRRWSCLIATGLSAAAFCAVSAAILGLEPWRVFLAHTGMARAALEQNLVGDAKLQSLFAAARLWHAPVPVAYAVQAAGALAAAILLARACWRRSVTVGTGAAMVTATLLTTPFLLGYDLMLLAIPLLWTFGQARRTGFLPWEKIVLMAAFFLPLVSAAVATWLRIPLAPPVIAALFAVVIRRLTLRSPPTATG